MKHWKFLYIWRQFRKNRMMNICSFMAIFLALFSTFLMMEVSANLNSMTYGSFRNYHHSKNLTLSKKETQMIEGTSLSLVKTSRPDLNEMKKLKTYLPILSYEYDLSAFFASYPKVNYYGREHKVEYVPLWQTEENSGLIIEGQEGLQSLHEVIINKESAELFGLAVGKEITVRLETQNIIFYKNDKLIINFQYSFKSKIKGIVEEFSFMNSPRIYYSYMASKDFLINNHCLEISSRYQEKVSYYELIRNSNPSEELSSFSFLIFAASHEEAQSIYSFFKSKPISASYEVSSFAMHIKEMLSASANAMELMVVVFSIIMILITMLVVVFASFFNFERNKKETTILATIGAGKRALLLINIIPNIILSAFALFLTMILLIIGAPLLDNLLFSLFSFKNLFQIGHFLESALLYGSVTLLITLLVSYSLVDFKLTSQNHADSLKEE